MPELIRNPLGVGLCPSHPCPDFRAGNVEAGAIGPRSGSPPERRTNEEVQSDPGLIPGMVSSRHRCSRRPSGA